MRVTSRIHVAREIIRSRHHDATHIEHFTFPSHFLTIYWSVMAPLIRTAIIGDDYHLHMRRDLSNLMLEQPARFDNLFYDECMAKALDLEQTCEYIYMDYLPSAFVNGTADRLTQAAMGYTRLLLIQLAAWDLGDALLTPDYVADRVIELARQALHQHGFTMVVFVSAIYWSSRDIAEDLMIDRLEEYNSILRKAATRHPRIRFYQLRSFRYTRIGRTPPQASEYLDQNNNLCGVYSYRYKQGIKHAITSAVSVMQKRLRQFLHWCIAAIYYYY